MSLPLVGGSGIIYLFGGGGNRGKRFLFKVFKMQGR